MVGQRHLSRARHGAATDQSGVADRVMRGAEGAGRDQGTAVHETHDAVHARRLDGLVQGEGGRMVGSRFASIVFPEPGGPTMMTLWPPAAATSRARLTCSWPFTSLKSMS